MADRHDLVIIGGAPGGYAAALYGTAAGLDVAMVENQKVGGTCLHVGCIPAKSLLETAAVRRALAGAAEFGFTIDEEIWRREATDELPLKTFDSNDFRTGVNWDSTLASWKRAGLAFEWDRDSKRSRTGFIHRNTLQSAEGRLLELRQHHPEPHGD